MDSVTQTTVIITTPASTVGYIHMIASAELTAAGTFTFSEAPETSGGSALTVYNNYRGNATTSGTSIVGGVTWTSAGTVIETHYIGSNGATLRVGGEATGRNEYILAPSTKYGYRITNVAATCNSSITLYFYLE